MPFDLLSLIVKHSRYTVQPRCFEARTLTQTGSLFILGLQGRVHHDLKGGNLVRFFDGTYRLVDLDNSRKAGIESHGMTSLEICPPEM